MSKWLSNIQTGELDEYTDIELEWEGWTTTLTRMLIEGWEMRTVRRSHPKARSEYITRLRHPKLNKLAVFYHWERLEWGLGCYRLEHLLDEHNGRIKGKKVKFDSWDGLSLLMADLTYDDYPVLLNKINDLMKQKIKAVNKKTNSVVEFKPKVAGKGL